MRRLSFREVQARFRQAMGCPDCEKSTIVLNVSIGRGFRPERITTGTHCDCPARGDQKAGPAYKARS